MRRTIIILAFSISAISWINWEDKPENKSYLQGLQGNENFKSYVENAKGLKINMIAVEGGTYIMGDTLGEGNDNERPAHKVTLNNFYISDKEITQKQWRKIMGTSPSSVKNMDFLPVDNVSWKDIQEFVAKLNQLTGKKYRLPTEAEWEYAAKGGNKSQGFRFSGSNNLSEVGVYADNSGNIPNTVGRKKPNELGIYDMSGNVWEWVQDQYYDYTEETQTNPLGTGNKTTGISKGGSWSDFSRLCRITIRKGTTFERRSADLGFRIVAEL